MFHFKLNPKPPRYVGRETIGQEVDSSAMVRTPGWRAYTTSFNRLMNAMAAKFSRLSARGGGWRGFLDTLVSWEGFHVAWQFALRMIGVAILSAAFTIVSSRLSDTQLPVKITILDAWGAMTIGFVSYFIGQKFILTLTNWGSVGSSSNSGTDKTAAGK